MIEANNIVGIDRRPYNPPRAFVAGGSGAFRQSMVKLWRRSLIGLTVLALASQAALIGVAFEAGLHGLAETVLALAAVSISLHLAFSAFEFFTRKPPTFRHEHYHHHGSERKHRHG